MRKFISQLLSVLLLAGVAVTAEAAKKGPPPKDPGITAKVTAVDKAGKNFTLDGKTIAVDSGTIVQRDGKPSSFEEIKVGDQVNVTTVNLADKLTAVTVKVGAVASISAGGKKPKK